jgi:hypothetical protein
MRDRLRDVVRGGRGFDRARVDHGVDAVSGIQSYY